MTRSGALSQIARSTPLHVAFAFVAMGGWAAFVNRANGARAEMLAFLVQGALSAFLTLVLKTGLETAFLRLPPPLRRILPPVVSALLILGLLTGVHSLAGTPEVLKTVAVPWTVSTIYAFVYVLSLPGERAP
jgi:hypothetical protein